MFEWHTELLDPGGLGFLVIKLTGYAQKNRFISFHFQILGNFWGYTDMRWLCSICNVHFIFGDSFSLPSLPCLMRAALHSIRGRRVDPWQKRCHRHCLWLRISENSGNWWVLIHSDIYIYIHTYHTIPYHTIPYHYPTLHYITYILYIHIHTHTHIAIGWMIYGILSAWEWR